MLCLLALLIGCETSNYAPDVTPQIASRTKGQSADAAMLREGRLLFVHRCIECHTLPATWHYTNEDWREILDRMAHRASLKPAERDAILAYIRATRAQ